MTISAYETLYESSIAYGVRKALIAEKKRIDLGMKLMELAVNKRDLQQQVNLGCVVWVCWISDELDF